MSSPGTNSPGPYSLRFSPIIDGTEQVRVDGQRKPGSIIPSTTTRGCCGSSSDDDHPGDSTIEVSYDTPRMGSNPGILADIRSELPCGPTAG